MLHNLFYMHIKPVLYECTKLHNLFYVQYKTNAAFVYLAKQSVLNPAL